MKLKNLGIKKFLSFLDIFLDFRGRQFTLILGRNNDTTSMDSNGSGKSGLLEAIVWLFFGITCRGLKGDAVVNSAFGKDCQVSADIEVDGSEISVTRYRKHTIHKNDLVIIIDGQEQKRMTPTETQGLLEDTIHMNYETFMNTTIFPQGAFTYFASMADADRKDLLESVMGMMPFDEYLGRARNEQKRIENGIQELEMKQIEVLGRVETEGQHRDELIQKERSFEDDRKREISSIGEAIQEARGNLKRMEESISELDLEGIQAEIEGKKQALKNLEVDDEERQKLIQSLADSQAKVSFLEASRSELENELRDLKDLKPGQECPLFKGKKCEQMTEKDIGEHLDKIRSRIAQLKDQVEKEVKAESASKAALDALDNQRKAYAKIEDDIEQSRDRFQELRDKQAGFASSKERIRAEIERLEAERTEHKSRTSPYASMVGKSRGILDSLTKEKAKQETDLAEMGKKQEYIQFWVEGFGDRGLKSFLLDSVVQQLNERANHYLSYLTDGKVRVEISTRTRLKGGEEREKLDIRVYSKEGLQEYLGSSGGEKRRADLSLLLALRELAKARLEQTFDLLFVDEVFDVLDQSGIERVIHLLTQQTGDDVFVISHDPSLMDAFEEVITVEKTNGLSKII